MPSDSSSSGDPIEKQTFLWNHSLEVAFDKNGTDVVKKYDLKNANERIGGVALTDAKRTKMYLIFEPSSNGINYDDMYHYYTFIYETEKQLARPAENIRYYVIDSYGIYPVSRDELRLKEGEYSGDYRLVVKDGVVECILDHWLP